MPIGSGAQFSPSGIFQPGLPLPQRCAAVPLFYAVPPRSQPCRPHTWPLATRVCTLSFHSDQDLVVRAGPNDPLVDWIDQGDWNADPKCVVTGKVAMQIPLPDNFTTG